MPKTHPPVKLRLWTIEEYHRMAEVGILQPDESVELIAGQIIKKISPQGSPHAASIRRTDRVFSHRLTEQVLIQKQLPIQLNHKTICDRYSGFIPLAKFGTLKKINSIGGDNDPE